METQLTRLSEILSRELELCDRLVKILSVERQALVGDDADEVHGVLKRQETLILELKTLEEARIAIMNKLINRFQPLRQRLTLNELAELVDEPYASDYKKFGTEIASIMTKLDRANRDNAYLIDRSIDRVNSTLRIFATAEPFGYGDGSRPKKHGRNFQTNA